MRDSYREQLDEIVSDLIGMANTILGAVRTGTEALLNADLQAAETVISGDEVLDQMRLDIDQRAFFLLARQTPVAGELRLVVAALRIVAELERMGDLTAHVAKVARLRYPECAVPEDLRPTFARMALVAEKMVAGVGQALAERDVEDALKVQDHDAEMDDLRRSQFRVLLGDQWTHGVEAAVDVALLGRYYERIADHAETIARRLVYIVTGEFPKADPLG